MNKYINECYCIKWDNEGKYHFANRMPVKDHYDNDYTIAARSNYIIIQDNNTGIKNIYKVDEDTNFNPYVCKVLKTKIKAENGADGLYKFLKDNIENQFAEIWTYDAITRIVNNCKPYKF